MRYVFLIQIVVFAYGGYCQADTLNKLNTLGKKEGYWTEYFDENVLPTDSASSFFYGFQLYDNGVEVYSFSKFKEKKKLKLKSSLPFSEKGKPIPISGNFSWYSKDSILLFEENFEAGHPFDYKRY